MKLKIVFSILIISTFGTLFYQYIQASRHSEINDLARQSLQVTNTVYKAIIDTYTVVAERHFLSIMDNTEVLALLKKFKYETDESKKGILRGELYRLLYKEYEQLKNLFNVRQFHFHTVKGESLLRFHMPNESGDSLMDARYSIRQANTRFIKIRGFEGGKTYPGYRYVFPIIKDQEHLGSVEFSISFEGIEKKLKNILPFYAYKLILEKWISYDAVFAHHRSFFQVSRFDPNHYIENYELSIINKRIQDDAFVNKLIELTKQNADFHKLLHTKKNFSIPIIHKNKGYVVNFLSIYDTTDKIAGHLVSLGKLPEIARIDRTYDTIIQSGFMIALILFLLIISLIIQRENSQEQQKEMVSKLQQLINSQDSIIILTNGIKIDFANNKFFEFFGYKKLSSFLMEHNCIGEKFMHQDGFFSLSDKGIKDNHWIARMKKLPGRQRIVSMRNKNSELHAFTVSINRYDKKSHVINFTDISDTMLEKLDLEDQITHDELTNAYNRVYYNSNISRLININKQKNEKTGIIFFDIDHFKKVNDTYGHYIGDTTLKNLVFLLMQHIRISDKLIRWGGEEFVIISSANTLNDVFQQAEYLRKKIEQHSFVSVKKLTCSFGVAISQEGIDIKETIKAADKKLYDAKAGGRNKVVS